MKADQNTKPVVARRRRSDRFLGLLRRPDPRGPRLARQPRPRRPGEHARPGGPDRPREARGRRDVDARRDARPRREPGDGRPAGDPARARRAGPERPRRGDDHGRLPAPDRPSRERGRHAGRRARPPPDRRPPRRRPLPRHPAGARRDLDDGHRLPARTGGPRHRTAGDGPLLRDRVREHGYPRESGPADDGALVWLYPRADKDLLAQIRSPRLPASYYATAQHALANAFLYGDVLVCWCGAVEQPDIVAELADFFIRYDAVRWVVAIGLFDDQLRLSARVASLRSRSGEVLRAVVDGLGTAGGHDKRAGGAIPLSDRSPEAIDALSDHPPPPPPRRARRRRDRRPPPPRGEPDRPRPLTPLGTSPRVPVRHPMLDSAGPDRR